MNSAPVKPKRYCEPFPLNRDNRRHEPPPSERRRAFNTRCDRRIERDFEQMQIPRVLELLDQRRRFAGDQRERVDLALPQLFERDLLRVVGHRDGQLQSVKEAGCGDRRTGAKRADIYLSSGEVRHCLDVAARQ